MVWFYFFPEGHHSNTLKKAKPHALTYRKRRIFHVSIIFGSEFSIYGHYGLFTNVLTEAIGNQKCSVFRSERITKIATLARIIPVTRVSDMMGGSG